MRIVLYGMNYAPELTGIGKYNAELAEWLVEKGNSVRVISPPPYYPEWRVHSGYSNLKYKIENIKGVEVWRCPLWVPKKITGKRRVMHLLSYALTSFPSIVAQLRWRPDIIISVEPPIMCAPMALLVAKMCGAKSCLHVQDFEVDAAFQLNILKSKNARLIVEWMEKCITSRFDKVSSISQRMLQKLGDKGICESKKIYFPNWVDLEVIFPQKTNRRLKAEIGLPTDSIVALYSGNIGRKQNIDTLLEAAYHLLNRSDIYIVICGDGVYKKTLMEKGEGCNNVLFIPLQPLEKLNELLNMADIHLLPQSSDAADLVMPSKLSGMFASGRPVIATADDNTQVASIVGNCGVVVSPGDAKGIANAILKLGCNPQLRMELGMRAFQFCAAEWEKSAILHKFYSEVQKTLAETAN